MNTSEKETIDLTELFSNIHEFESIVDSNLKTHRNLVRYIFNNAIVKFLKKHAIYMKWACGTIFIHDEFKDSEPLYNVKQIINKLDAITEQCCKEALIYQDKKHCNKLWWLMSDIRTSGRINSEYKIVDYNDSFNK